MPPSLKPPALDPASVESKSASIYPKPFQAVVKGRSRRRLGDALGLTDFGVNLTRLEPGAASALRHWHTHEDEFIYVLEGEVTLVTQAGAQNLGSGMAAGFPKGQPDGHHLVNRGTVPVVYLEIGARHPADEARYPDVDLDLVRKRLFVHKDGTPWD
ncbi:MAG: cupin domain-containing protein [Rhodospirillales bacterium]|nr:cupin domain-containing protein [Rhodospirillales bacterium]